MLPFRGMEPVKRIYFSWSNRSEITNSMILFFDKKIKRRTLINVGKILKIFSKYYILAKRLCVIGLQPRGLGFKSDHRMCYCPSQWLKGNGRLYKIETFLQEIRKFNFATVSPFRFVPIGPRVRFALLSLKETSLPSRRQIGFFSDRI